MAKNLTEEFVFRFSPTQQLHTDQGELVAEICKLLDIEKTHTTPYHAQADGL